MKTLWNTIKKHKRFAVLVATLVVILTISGAWYVFASSANPFEDYELNDGNALQVYVKQSLFKGSSNVGAAKYSTDWYLFFEDDYQKLLLFDTSNWEKSIFTKYGQHVNLNHVAYGEEDEDGRVMQTREIAATELVEILLEEYTGDRRSELDDPITVYFAPVITCTLYNMQGKVKKQEKVYSYEEFRAFADNNGFKNNCWPASTDGAVASMYNTPLELQLSTAQLSVQFLDIDTGEEVEGFNFPVPEKYTEFVLYGETLSFSKGVEGNSDTHTYYGYQWGEGDVVKDKSPSGITVTRDVAPDEELVLTLYFKQKPAPTSPPPSPTHEAEVPSPTPTLAPEVTATPVPTSTPTPSPLPTATPKPEPEDYSIEQHGIWYFTTDKGYTIDEITSDSGNKLATYQRIGGSGGDVTSHEYTARTKKFKEGTDADGNIWYFLMDDDGSAIYVHPKVYTSFTVDSSEVQYITELTFPSEITSGSKTYPVTGIGGGTGKYVNDIDDEYYSSTVTDKATCGTVYGNHHYEYYKDSTNYYTNYGKTIEYGYGVLGNGFIVSEGYWQRVWNESFDDTEQYEEYESSFYVYNTTLYSITIPDSVTTIHPYAFRYCQKLSAIYGGRNVTSIGSHAFSATIDYVSNLSEYWEEGGEEEYKFYYYNKSYSVDDWTPVMLEWEKAVPQVKYLQLADFPALKSIGSSAFLYRRNLYNVALSDTVTSIASNAFGQCRLDSITIPSVTSQVYTKSEQTLGTGGLDDRTLVITVPDSKAFQYARDYMNYYILKCGHNITYEPNGGAEDARTFISDIEFLQGDYVYHMGDYVVEAGGKIFYLRTSGASMLVAEIPGFERCEMESSVTGYEYDSYNGQYYETAYDVSYLRDKENGLWRLLECDGAKKLEIPDNTEVLYYNGLPFYLGADGYVYYIPATHTAGKLFTYTDYEQNKSYYKVSAERLFMIDNVIYIEDSTGSWYKLTETAKKDSSGNYVYDDEGNQEYATTFAKISMPSGATPRIYVADRGYLISTNGNLWYKKAGSSWKKVNIGNIDLSGYSYKDGCLWTADGRYVQLLITSISGSSLKGYTATVTECTNGGAIREVFLLGNFLYIWREDGTLDYVNAINSTSMTEGTIASGQTFQQVQADLRGGNEKRGRMLALDTKGRIWAGGYQYEAELGVSGTTLMAPKIAASDRIYTEIALGERKSYALDEQGMLYGTGYSIYRDDVLNKQVDHNTFQRIPTVTTSVCLIEGDGKYVFTGDGRVEILDGDFTLIDLGYRFGTVLYNNMFTRTGYDFTGWNTTAAGSSTGYQPGDELLLEEDLVLYAQWKRSNNVIHYDGNGGIGYMPDTILEPEVTSTYLSENKFTMAGYKFTGWNTEPDGSGTAYAEEEFVPYIFGRMTLYAQWEEITTSYTLVYMKYPYGTPENTVWKQKILSYRQETTVEGAPYTATGYTVSYDINKPAVMSTIPAEYSLTEKNTKTDPAEFDRWMLYREDGSGGHRYGGRKYQTGQTLSMLTKTDGGFVYLYPSWKEMGAYVLLPETESGGWMFYGWSEYADGSGEIHYVMDESGFGGTYTPVKDTVLYGVWVPRRYVVALDGMEAEKQEQTEVTMTFDSLCPDVIIPERSRYVFRGYYTELDEDGVPTKDSVQYYDSDGKSTEVWRISDGSIDNLYAYWVPDKAIVYEPNYEPVEADCPAMETTWIDFDKTGTYLSMNIFTRTGYHFVGWNTEPDGSGTAYEDGQYVDGITTRVIVYAQWEPNTYNVHYAPDAYEVDPEITVGPEDVWEYDKVYVIKEKPYEKLDLVEYDLNRGTKSTVPELVTVLTDSHTKSIYPFLGYRLYEWVNGGYINLLKLFETGETVKNLTAEQGKNFVMFPEWNPVSIGVALPLAECRGYTFLGWAESAGETDESKALNGRYVTTGDTTLYGMYTPKKYLVRLDDRGATSTNHTEEVVMTFDEKGPDIVVPTKRGYTFHGYYTGTRGTGTRYYDADGVCVKSWTDDDVSVLYAYWTQDAVVLPAEDEHVVPVPLPEQNVEGGVGREDARALLYADDYNPATDALTDLQPYLTYDTPASEGSIPGTEQVAFRARMGAWMLSYRFHRFSGTDYVRIYVTVPYRTQHELENEELVISGPQTKTYRYMVPKTWSYWEVMESGMYYPSGVVVKNDALKDGSFTVPVERDVDVAVENPDYSITNYGEKENHVFWEEHDPDGVPVLHLTLSEEQYVISDVVGSLPKVDKHLSVVGSNAAWKDQRQAQVRSDGYVLGGVTVLSDELMPDGAGKALSEDGLPEDGMSVPLTSYLQTYKSGIELDEYKANGTYETEAVVIYEGDAKNVGAETTKTVRIAEVNPLKLHTPVACNGVALDGVEESDGKAVLVLEEALNFFTLRIENRGVHKSSLGYGEKNFLTALSGKSNVAVEEDVWLNQVRFPFGVYLDVGQDSQKNDGTYETSGDYYLEAGTWLTLGGNTGRFYVPVSQENGIYRVEFRTIAVNCPKNEDGNYLTEGREQLLVNTNVGNYVAVDELELEIRSSIEDFNIVNTNDPEALKQLEAGNQALTLKKGYEVEYEILSQGAFWSEEAEVEIVPDCYWVSSDGERKKVNLYFGEVVLKEAVRTYRDSEAYQRWRGSCYVPAEVLCVEEGFDLKEYASRQTLTGEEEFFKKDGFLVLNFTIRIKSDIGEWHEFSNWNHTELAEDALAAGWAYVAGDIVRYDLSKSAAEDYEVGGVE